MFSHLNALPADPLLSIIEKFSKDINPKKIDLGVGVYKTNEGKTPVLKAVKAAEKILFDTQESKSYLGLKGDVVFADLLSRLALGAQHRVFDEQRITALQTPGDCGALRVAAELLHKTNPNTVIWVSEPTWINHIPLLGTVGITIKEYPYYSGDTQTVQFDAMLACLSQANAGDIVLLHGCCHNPSGADLSQEQWQALTVLMKEKQLIPFVDMAYQGFGDNLDDDAFGLRHVCHELPEVIFALSCSKNFGVYRDRVGVIGFITETKDGVAPLTSHVLSLVRANYSMPPDHGAAVVRLILSDSELTEMWMNELTLMRERIVGVRKMIVEKMNARGIQRFDFIQQQKGMFSFLGINKQQVQEIAEKYAIYMADSSRVNIAGLTDENIEYFCDALANIV